MSASLRNPDPLLLLCYRKITNDFYQYINYFPYAPNCIKDRLLQYAWNASDVLEDIELLRALLYTNIERIFLNNCSNLNDDMLKELFICHNLKDLSITGPGTVSKDVLIELILHIPKLLLFSSVNCPFVDDDIIELLVNNCRSLNKVNIKGCKVTSASVTKLANLELKILIMYGFEITNDAVQNFLNSTSRDTIEELSLNCSAISAANLIRMCPNLHTFCNDDDTLPLEYDEVPRNMRHLTYYIP